MASIKDWLEQTDEQDKRLYEQYGKPLEIGHEGEYIAIADDGQTILGTNSDDVLRRAVEEFGSGNFFLTRLGEKAFGKWLSSSL